MVRIYTKIVVVYLNVCARERARAFGHAGSINNSLQYKTFLPGPIIIYSTWSGRKRKNK